MDPLEAGVDDRGARETHGARSGPGLRRRARGPGISMLLALSIGLSGPAHAVDRQDELEGLRDAIQESRERVGAHEADERALLERLEEVDKRLRSVSAERNAASRAVNAAREKLEAVEPKLEEAEAALARTRRALAARAVALYRGGEVGPMRVLFSSESLPEMLSRAGALRVLVRHDAELVERFGRERDTLDAVRREAEEAVTEREEADARLGKLVATLAEERGGKRQLLSRVREDRTSERRLLLELEQAAQALEETIRTLGAQSERDGGAGVAAGFANRQGRLAMPVVAEIRARFGRVVDPEFKTSTFRSGVEFDSPAGEMVRCVAPGIVRFAGWFRGYGRIVIVDHGDGFHTISGHLDEIDVVVDQKVLEGERLGSVGETGSLGGPGLYFELRSDGAPVDPEAWLLDARG